MDIEWRKRLYGTNNFPTFKIKSVASLISEAFGDSMLKILVVASILSILIEISNNNLRNNGWLQPASLILTFLVVTIVSSISAHNC